MQQRITSGFNWVIQNKEWIFSGIGVAILASIAGLTKYFKSRREQAKPVLSQISSTSLSPVDVSLLNQLAEIFSGDEMHTFFELLSESGSIFIDQVERLEVAKRRFSAPDKKFRNGTLEIAKREFFDSLGTFISFSTETFWSASPNRARFYHGISEYQLLTTHRESYQDDNEKFTKFAQNLQSKWQNLQDVVNSVVPDYEWK